MDKIKFTTTFDKELLKEIKIQAVKENRSVSDLLEQLTKEYLEKVTKEWCYDRFTDFRTRIV